MRGKVSKFLKKVSLASDSSMSYRRLKYKWNKTPQNERYKLKKLLGKIIQMKEKPSENIVS